MRNHQTQSLNSYAELLHRFHRITELIRPTSNSLSLQDLTAIGITAPDKRRRLKNEISKLQIEDGIPNFWPSSLDEWLELIRLTDYVKKLKEQGYTSVEKALELSWEDLEDIGIKKLGKLCIRNCLLYQTELGD